MTHTSIIKHSEDTHSCDCRTHLYQVMIQQIFFTPKNWRRKHEAHDCEFLECISHVWVLQASKPINKQSFCLFVFVFIYSWGLKPLILTDLFFVQNALIPHKTSWVVFNSLLKNGNLPPAPSSPPAPLLSLSTPAGGGGGESCSLLRTDDCCICCYVFVLNLKRLFQTGQGRRSALQSVEDCYYEGLFKPLQSPCVLHVLVCVSECVFPQ